MDTAQRIGALSAKLVDIAGLVESLMASAVLTLVENNTAYGTTVRKDDVRVHQACLELEKECIETLVSASPLDVPTASTLVGLVKVAMNLKGMADESENILARTSQLCRTPLVPDLADVGRMLEIVQSMHSDVVEAWINRDPMEAKSLMLVSRQLRALKGETIARMAAQMEQNPDLVQAGIQVALIARSLLRVGDYITEMAITIVHILSEAPAKAASVE